MQMWINQDFVIVGLAVAVMVGYILLVTGGR
jgi:hypothetical protein